MSIVAAFNPESSALCFQKTLLVLSPTGAYCREDRCQSYFKFKLIPTLRAPMEECEIAGGIASVDGDVEIIDAPAMQLSDEEFLQKVSEASPDLIIMAITFGSLSDDLVWSKRLKTELPNVSIGLRGAPCYVNGHRILEQNSEIDFCLRGDYELAAAGVVTEGYVDSPGVIWRDGEEIQANDQMPFVKNLDELPISDRSSIDPELYTVRGINRPQATIHVQRGCPYPCSYCLVHTVSGKKARHRSPGSIASEMRELVETGIRCFYLRAETFTLDRSWVLETCREIAKQAPRARWVTTTRVDRVDDEVIKAMKDAGCYGISFGIDVGSETIAAKVGKTVDRDQTDLAMRLCDKHGVISLGYIMIGFAWDTEETIREAEELILSVKPDLITVHFAHPYPGTRYYEDVQGMKLDIVSLKAQSEPALGGDILSTEDLEKASKKILRKHYFRPSVAFKVSRKFLRLARAVSVRYVGLV